MPTSVWDLDEDNLHVIFNLRNKFFDGSLAGDGCFDHCVVCRIVKFVQFYVLFLKMSHDVDGRYIGLPGVAVT